MSALVDWDDVENWGRAGTNVHESAWAADGTHDDNGSDDQ